MSWFRSAALTATLALVLSCHGLITRQSDLQSCLSGLQVAFPNDPSYPQLSQAFNSRLHFSPVAVVGVTTVKDIQVAVKCGANTQTPVVARSGGHSYAAFGVGGQDGSLVIDLSALKNITYANDHQQATVQTGNRLGDVGVSLWNNGQRALPHGTCPDVGSGGHTSYGGYGFLSRFGGLLLDRVVSAEVVLANGTIVTASRDSHPDLFWALRGAAPSYGIVTQWVFDTLPAPNTTVTFNINLPVFSDATSFVSAFKAYQSFVRNAPNEMGMSLAFGSSGSALSVTLLGNYYGTQDTFNSLVQPLVAQFPGTTVDAHSYTNWTDVLLFNAQGLPLQTSTPEKPDNFFAKSLTVSVAFEDDALNSWAQYLFAKGVSADLDWFIEVDNYGGAIATADATYSSYAHRNAFLVIQFYGSARNGGPFPTDGIDIINGMVTSLSPSPSAAYPNYIDPTLNATEWQSQYFGQNIDRLMQIKAAYDPSKVFTFPQSIPLPGSSTLALNGTENPHGSGSWSTRAIRRRSTVNGCIVLSLVMIAVTNFF